MRPGSVRRLTLFITFLLLLALLLLVVPEAALRKTAVHVWGRISDDPLTFEITRLRWGRASLSDGVIGSPAEPLLKWGSVSADFSGAGLKQGKLDTIAVDDLWLALRWQDDSPALPLLDGLALPASRPGRDKSFNLPFDTLKLSNLRLSESMPQQDWQPADSSPGARLDFSYSRTPGGDLTLFADLQVAVPQGRGSLLLQLAGKIEGSSLTGRGEMGMGLETETESVINMPRTGLEFGGHWHPESGFLADPPVKLPRCEAMGLDGITVQIESISFSDGLPVALLARAEIAESSGRPELTVKKMEDRRSGGWEASLHVAPFILTPEDSLHGMVTRYLPLPELSLSGYAGGTVTARRRAEDAVITSLHLQTSNLTAATPLWRLDGLSASADFFIRQGRLRSQGEQVLTFNNASIGALKLDGGKIQWDISGDRLRIISAELDWLDGKLQAYALNFDVKKHDANFVLYVDGIHVGRLIELIKPLQGAGDGRLYGRMPVKLKDGKWKITTAYLYSMPGQDGIIKLQDTAPLVAFMEKAGIASDTRDTLAQALKDFRFASFAMELQPYGTSGEATLSLRLQGVSQDSRRPTPVNASINLQGPLETLLNASVYAGHFTKGERK